METFTVILITAAVIALAFGYIRKEAQKKADTLALNKKWANIQDFLRVYNYVIVNTENPPNTAALAEKGTQMPYAGIPRWELYRCLQIIRQAPTGREDALKLLFEKCQAAEAAFLEEKVF